jgi:hypothetical protein
VNACFADERLRILAFPLHIFVQTPESKAPLLPLHSVSRNKNFLLFS